jgi:hypothetical protein
LIKRGDRRVVLIIVPWYIEEEESIEKRND